MLSEPEGTGKGFSGKVGMYKQDCKVSKKKFEF
jgi:hypothetical protein